MSEPTTPQTVPAFTQLPNGFITTQQLPDGKWLVESWWLNLAPDGSDKPQSDPVCHWIADSADEVHTLIAEFTATNATIFMPTN